MDAVTKRAPLPHDGTAPRARSFEQEVAAFVLNEARRDYNRLGYFPVAPEMTAALIERKRAGEITRDEMLALYRAMAGRPE